jgi:glutamate synthase domain-containing protein 1
MEQQPSRWGLYEPDTEKDSCGVGFVANIKGQASRSIVEQGLEVLERMRHRAATGADPLTGDGAGILVQLPHRFFHREGLALGFDMPTQQRYGVGQVFLPADPFARAECERIFAEVVHQEHQRLLGWRDVPVDPSHLGPLARKVMPVIRQVYIARRRVVPSAFERKLFLIRKLVENRVAHLGVDPRGAFTSRACRPRPSSTRACCCPRSCRGFYADLL